MEGYCPKAAEKIYILLVFSLIFTTLLTSINVLNSKRYVIDLLKIDHPEYLINIGILVNIISFIYTIYLLYKDLSHSTLERGWRGLYLIIFMLCATYLLSYGIMVIHEDPDQTKEKYGELTKVSISAIICGAIGILYTITDGLMCFNVF